MKNVLGMYDELSHARAAIKDLEARGFRGNAVGAITRHDAQKGADHNTVFGNSSNYLTGTSTADVPGIGSSVGAGPLAGSGSLVKRLHHLGVEDDLAHAYAEGVRRGGTMVAVHTDDSRATDAAKILDSHGAYSPEARAHHWKSQGWGRFDESAKPYSREEIDRDRNYYQSDEGRQKLEAIEEELQIGKREVERGRVRAYTHTTETPIEEQVELRDEEIHVDRRNVDREVRPGDDAFQDREIEVSETDEEAVVNKRARVTEEVTLGKDVHVNKETVRDTVRRQDVEVERDDRSDRPARDDQRSRR